MRVLLLSPYPAELRPALESTGDDVVEADAFIACGADFVVSYGYPRIVGEPVLSEYRGRIVNLHLSLLPWNKGADPNFWSWIENTPKGVTLHHVDAGIDTGDVIAQREVRFEPGHTLATSYETLRAAARVLFAEQWPRIRSGQLDSVKQAGQGSFHRARDRLAIWHLFPQEWDTPVADLPGLHRADPDKGGSERK